jgi:3-hydroxyacyl-CoA dehydrogenase
MISARTPARPARMPATGDDWPLATRDQVVGVVGLGHMGEAFAMNLIADGFRILAYDRHPERLEPIRLAGGEAAPALTSLAERDVGQLRSLTTTLSKRSSMAACRRACAPAPRICR